MFLHRKNYPLTTGFNMRYIALIVASIFCVTLSQDCIQNASMINGLCECNNGFSSIYDEATSMLLLCESVPTYEPTEIPTYEILTEIPTYDLTQFPTEIPTDYIIEVSPTVLPSLRPTRIPTPIPTRKPTMYPTYRPTRKPTAKPTARPSRLPTAKPTTRYPTANPTSAEPTYDPTTSQPTYEPSSSQPTSAQPTYEPSYRPISEPTHTPSYNPTFEPTHIPSYTPTFEPTYVITHSPTYLEVYPLVNMKMSRIISGCSPLILDWSDSTGNDGHTWNNVTFDVILLSESQEVDLNELVYYLNNNIRSPIVIPNSYLTRNTTYIITLTLCNHRENCGTSSQSVLISATDDAVPTVNILGARTRTMTRNQELLLSSSAYTTQCDGTRSTNNIQYTWSLFDNTRSFVSESRDPSKLKISANMLDAGKTYMARIMVAVRDKIAYSTVIVNIIPSNINTVVSGASNKQLKLEQQFVLDASQSYDLDVPTLLGQSNPLLQFSVHCIQLYPESINNCDAINIVKTNRRDTWQIISKSDIKYINYVSRLIITVNDTNRIATSMVDVTIIQPSAPIITMINREQQLTSLDVTKPIALSATIESESSCISLWSSSIFDDINGISLVPVSLTVIAGTSRTINLVLKPNVLYTSMSYTFSLECGTTKTYISLTTNGPPQYGIYEVSPLTGIELSTRFLMTASEWSDTDLPITYQFGFVSPDGFMTIQGKSEQSYSLAMLPAGEPLTIKVQVYDLYGASSIAQTDINIQKLNNEQLMSSITTMMDTSSSVDDTKQILSIVSSIINVVDCNLASASYCAALNRESCVKTENMCGECITGYYGDMGDSIEMCMPLHSRVLQEAIPKMCASATCSGHGLCVYENTNTGTIQDECNLGDATCQALCMCDTGYNGQICSITDDVLRSKRVIREGLINKLQDLTESEDITHDILDTWTTNIGSISRNPLELSNDALIKVQSVADIILSNTDSLTTTMSEGLLNVLDITITEQSRRNRALSDVSVTPMMDLLSKYGALMANDMYSGQTSMSVVRNNFKVIAQAFDGEDSILRLPQTSLESYAGMIPSEIQINSQQQPIKISLISTPAKLYGSNIDVNPVRVQISSDAPNAEMQFTVVLQNNNAIDYESMVSKSVEKYTSVCEDEEQSNNTYICENGYIIEHICHGTYMLLMSECPSTIGRPKCSDNCKMVAYTQTNTTCECSVLFRRRMETGQKIMDNTGITDIMSMTEYIAGDFIGTFSSASTMTPKSMKNAIIVISMFVVLWTVGLGLITMYVVRSKYAMIWKRQDMQINLERRKRSASISKSPYAIHSYLTEYVNTVFPSVYNQIPFISRIWGEIIKHHRYVHLFIGSSMRKTKGIVSGIQLLTIQTMLMFLLAVFYDLQGPSDDGSCQQYNVMEQCLKRRSFLDHTETYCDWNYNTEICSYNPPTFGWKTIAIIGIVVSMMTSIINFPMDYCFEIINAPTFSSQIQTIKQKINKAVITKELPDKLQNAYELAASSLSVIYSVAKRIQENRLSRQFHMRQTVTRSSDYLSNISDEDSTSEYSVDDSDDSDNSDDSDQDDVSSQNNNDHEIIADSSKLLVELLNDINCQRRLLSEEETIEYDYQWGLDPTGEFISKNVNKISIWNTANMCKLLRRRKTGVAAEVLLKELDYVKAQTDLITKDMQNKTDSQRGYDLLRIFILDILGRDTISARIFEKKSNEDIKNTRYVTFGMKGLAWSGVICTNLFFVYFTILKGYIKGIGWQQSFLAGCITQLLLEVLLFETFECIWVNYIIPSLVWKEVNAAYKLIQVTIDELCNINTSRVTDYVLNAPDYLFVSTNVAKQYPNLIESIIIKTYQSHLPGELYKKWKYGSSTLYLSPHNARFGIMSMIMVILQTIGASPFVLQRMIIRVSQPVILAGTVVFFTYVLSSAIISSVLSVVGFFILMYVWRRHYINSKKPVHSIDKLEYDESSDNKQIELNTMTLAKIMPSE